MEARIGELKNLENSDEGLGTSRTRSIRVASSGGVDGSRVIYID